MLFSCPVSLGEIIDKITILQIKKDKITDPLKVSSIDRELTLLSSSFAYHITIYVKEKASLYDVNSRLWDVEDQLRILESSRRFDDEFIQLARSVYHLNDKRAAIKLRINTLSGSEIVEQKSYSDYSICLPD